MEVVGLICLLRFGEKQYFFIGVTHYAFKNENESFGLSYGL